MSLEEKKRGIIINLIFVIYEIENRKYGYIDCFGYKDYIKNMIIGNFKNFILLVKCKLIVSCLYNRKMKKVWNCLNLFGDGEY